MFYFNIKDEKALDYYFGFNWFCCIYLL